MLINNWKMTYGEYSKLECKVPCSMYSVLLDHGIIADPFYGLNELELTKLSDNDCMFESEFEITSEMMNNRYTEITFYGLDTICEIYINDQLIDKVKNMHRAYSYDIKGIINTGTNTIRLNFFSPTRYFKKMNNIHYVRTPSHCTAGAAHLRKPLYMSGWDWGPKLPDMGIFRKIEINSYNTDKIDNVFVIQHHCDEYAELEIQVETKRNSDCELYAETDGQKIMLKNGKGLIRIKNPKLWWARGYGEQYLYELSVKAEKSGETIDENRQKIGIRTLTVSTEKDKIGSEFCFVLNGVKIFAMGANYIPQDNILSRISHERTEILLKQAADANFNCIRVWGGGYYPEDEFYELCDEMGIIVWQDFMSACMGTWLSEYMETEYTQEVIYNLKRLRNHPSLAILCGNNEIEEEESKIGESMLLKTDYLNLYERIIPRLCAKYAPQTFYWPSSPSSGGGFDDPTCNTRGDVHYWAVWHGGIPFTDYRNHLFRFCSEYGFESYPSMKTIKSFCEERDMNCFSRVMENHQKNNSGNTKILTYLSDTYLYPSTFENLVYASQMLQADAIKYGVEYFRRIRGICMGSIYWQFNDCWPVASWSSVDYYGRYKALHYAAKKFYAPVAMGLFAENGIITVNISNETMNEFEGKIEIKMCTNDFTVKKSSVEKVCVNALSSKDICEFNAQCANIYETYIYADLYDAEGNFIMRQTELMSKPKHFEWLKPHITFEISHSNNTTAIALSSDVFAKGVYVDFKDFGCNPTDNFFDITDTKPYIITLGGNYTKKQIEDSIMIKSVYDIDK